MEIQRESMDVDVLFVGAGPANLASAIRLGQLVLAHNEAIQSRKKDGEALDELMIMMVEKAPELGGHSLSGAVMDPIAIKELMPDYMQRDFPEDAPVVSDEVLLFSENRYRKAPFVPPTLRQHGYHIVSLNRVVKWMAGFCEDYAIEVMPGFPAAKLLIEDGGVVGVQTGDMGIGHDGEPRSNFEPGMVLKAKVTVLGEGPRGHLTKYLTREMKLDEGRNPQIYGTGIKEIWKLPKGRAFPGKVTHTAGFPLHRDQYGGTWIYHIDDEHVSIGMVVGLDWKDPYLDPHRLFTRFKQHPYMQELLGGGEIVRYGAKTIPEGGYYSMPRMAVDGCVIVGDSASLLNTPRLKGIHTAMKSGMLAAETIFQALISGDTSSATLGAYPRALDESWLGKELYKVRNFRQPFRKGKVSGMMWAALAQATGGRLPSGKLRISPDHTDRQTVAEFYDGQSPDVDPFSNDLKGDGLLDKLTDVYHSGAIHEENQPSHLQVATPELCGTICAREYGNPCQYFCPAGVYEIVDDESEGKKLQINFSNCVHCKTCDISDPYEVITWVTPEGGGGPDYTNM
ncbi:MAG: electron transfer flavoprotein [Gemmatimonadetes bacterium]|nr:electron transfer flavoprotein [Gemmatimonadota bacterium]